jgi:hypothetical protein
MIADHPRHFDSAQFVENIGSRTSGDNHAGIESRQASQQVAGSIAHASLIEMIGNSRKRSIKIERAQRSLLSKPRQKSSRNSGREDTASSNCRSRV